MDRIRPYPGLISTQRSLDECWLRAGASVGWGLYAQELDEWRGQVHVVRTAALSAEVREALAVELPEHQLGEGRPWLRRMYAAARLRVVRSEDRSRLIEEGVRVYTVGFHRNPSLLRIVGVGGGAPTLWFEQSIYVCYGPNPRVCALRAELPWIPGPRSQPAYAECRDFDRINRILRAVTDDVIDEQGLALAVALDRDKLTDLWRTEPARRKELSAHREDLRDLLPLLKEPWAEEGDWLHQAILDCEHPLARATEMLEEKLAERTPSAPHPELLALVEAVVAGEIERVRVEAGLFGDERCAGVYARERTPSLRLVKLSPKDEGWLPPVSELWADMPAPDPSEGYFHVPAGHRYVRISG